MANQFVNYFSKRRNRTPNSSTSESESPESKRSKNLEECVEENEDGDVIIDALEMTGEIAGTLKGILEKLQKLDTIESSVKRIETTMENLELRIANLETFEQTATTDIEHLKESVTQNENKCIDHQKRCEKKLKKIKDMLAELDHKEQEINNKLKELTTKDLYLEAYSRRENIKFNYIPETPSSGENGENTEAVLRAFLEKELGYADGSTVEIQRVHRLGKIRNETPRPILARFLRSKDVEKILSLGSRLKGTNFQMFRDLPQELVDRRRAQMENYKHAKRNGIPVSFSRSKPDQLYIRGKLFPPGQILRSDG